MKSFKGSGIATDHSSRRRRGRRAACLAAATLAPVTLLTLRSRADIAGFNSDFTLNGGATIAAGSLQLTDTNTSFEDRSTFYRDPQYIGGFSAQFTYVVSGTAGLGPADGFAFVLSNPTNGLNALGGSGGNLGYGGISNSAAVAFNLWQSSSTAMGSNGVIGAYSLTTPAVDLRALSSPVHVTVNYAAGVLRETLIQGTNIASAVLGSIDLFGVIGSSTAHVGFTGATGLGQANQRISGFTFASSGNQFQWNVTDGNFGVASNWDQQMVPGLGGVPDTVTVNRTFGARVHVTSPQGPIHELDLAYGNTLAIEPGGSFDTDNLVLNGGTVRIGDGASLHTRSQTSLSLASVVQTGGVAVFDTNSSYPSLLVGGTYAGAYYLSGGTLRAAIEGIPNTGLFNQSGGDHQASYIYVGGTAILSGGTLRSGTANIQPGATFTQTGGSHTVSTDLLLGSSYGSPGTYRLSGLATLAVGGNEYLGAGDASSGGSGAFSQTGGTHTISGNLILGGFFSGSPNPFGGVPVASGTFTLGPGAVLTVAGNESVADRVWGTFNQSGGTHAIVGGLTIGAGSNALGHFIQSAGTLTVAKDEYVGKFGVGTLDLSSGTHSIAGQLFLGGGLGPGATHIGSGTISLSGSASLSANAEAISPLSSFTQTGGVNLTGSLAVNNFTSGFPIGSWSTDPGYTLAAGGMLHVATGIPQAGTASTGNELLNTGGFTQTGGLHLIDGNLLIGSSYQGHGAFALSGGTVVAALNVYLGGYATNTAAAAPAAGMASPDSVIIIGGGGIPPYGGQGNLNISGGSFSIQGGLVISPNPGTSSGTVTLSGGALIAGSMLNHGSFIQSGGSSSLGPVGGTGSISLGGGTAFAQMTVTSLAQGAVSVSNNASLTILPATARLTHTIGALSLSGNGTLDIANHDLLVTGSYASVNGWVKQAAGAPTGPLGLNPWTGSGGITSSLVKTDAANGHPGHMAIGIKDNADYVASGNSGKPIAPGNVLISYAAYGDANLDNTVDISDLSIWNNNFATGDHWGQGDFNYDGKVDIADLSIWNNNFAGKVTPSSAAPSSRTTFAASPRTLSGSTAVGAPTAPTTPPANTLELDIDATTGDAVINSGGVSIAAVEIDSAAKDLITANWKSFKNFYHVSGWSFTKGVPNTAVVAEFTSDASSTGTPIALAQGSLTDYGNIVPVGFSNQNDLTFKYNIVLDAAGNTQSKIGNVVITGAVPEPTSLGLVALAGAGLLMRRRKRAHTP